jgi:rod shape-determining protein MreC
MQQIFNFIYKNSYRLLFLLLLGIALALTIQSHSYHKSKVISSANFFTGGVYAQINSVNEYFNLRTRNEELAAENAELKSIVFSLVDTVTPPKLDSIRGVSKKNIIVAKVIHNSYNQLENYLTIDAGKNDGVTVDMGVINSRGLIGIVDKTSGNYAAVQSILNLKSKINAKLKKSNHFGTLKWDGKNAGYVQLVEIPRLAMLRKGDTIVTGGASDIFPENINIGTIDKIYTDEETNYFTLSIRLFNDMTNLGHVYVIKKDREEILELQAQTRKDE